MSTSMANSEATSHSTSAGIQPSQLAIAVLVDTDDRSTRLKHNGKDGQSTLDSCTDQQLTYLLDLENATAPNVGRTVEASYVEKHIQKLDQAGSQWRTMTRERTAPRFVQVHTKSTKPLETGYEEESGWSFIPEGMVPFVCTRRGVESTASAALKQQLQGHIGEDWSKVCRGRSHSGGSDETIKASQHYNGPVGGS